jgi:hypothetical protein
MSYQVLLRRKKIQATILHPTLAALGVLLLMSACTGISSSAPLDLLASTDTPSQALATVTPSRGRAPASVAAPVGVSLPLPQDDTTTWYLPGSPDIAAMRDTIVTVLRTNELEFDLGYPVQGFSPDPIYPRLFIRDTSTLMSGTSYFYPAERLRWGVEAFLRQQYDTATVSTEDGWRAGFGAISATVGPDGVIDKATAVSDEDAHLIHAAYVVYQVDGGVEWLTEELTGLSIIARLSTRPASGCSPSGVTRRRG